MPRQIITSTEEIAGKEKILQNQISKVTTMAKQNKTTIE